MKANRLLILPFKRSWILSTRSFTSSVVRRASDDVSLQDKQIGEEDSTESTGVIEKTDRETLLYFSNILPFKVPSSHGHFISYLQDLIPKKRESAVRKEILDMASPKNNIVPGLTLNSVFMKDGGAFAKFRLPFDASVSETNLKIQQNTNKTPPRWFGILPATQCFPVRGTPWVEDLRRYPSTLVKITFEGEDIDEESLYQVTRRYGSIVDIMPQPTDSKELPRYSVVRYKNLRSAICAKNCINQLKVDNTVLHATYKRIIRENVLKDFLVNHTRISVPLVLAVLLALATIIFEPIREFFIQEKISKRFSFNYKDNKVFQWFMSYFARFRKFLSSNRREGFSLGHVWSERMDKIKELQLWLTENVDTFIVVRGPKGIGKHEVVMDHALKNRENVLYIDCEALTKSRNDSDFLKASAHQIGYFPIFPWLNSFSTFIDLGVQGLTGQKSGFSETIDTQFKTMLSMTSLVIRRLALRYYSTYLSKSDADAEGSKRLTEEDYLQQNPNEKPVVVIDKFTYKSESYSFVYPSIAQWASFLISMNIAHVIFLIDDIGAVPLLTESLPDQVFKYSTLSDASLESSRDYVMTQLEKEDEWQKIKQEEGDKTQEPVSHKKYSASSIENALAPIGGRMLDLQAFVRRVKSGESPYVAQHEMIKQAAEQIIQMNLLKSRDEDTLTPARSWEIIKLLAKQEAVPYAKIYTSPLFKSSPTQCLSDLEKSSMISIVRERGIIKEIRASRPLYRSAYLNIVNDPKSFSVFETGYLLQFIAFETNRIKGWETELNSLGYVASAEAIKPRFEWLTNKITLSTRTIEQSEARIKELAQVFEQPKKAKSMFAIF